MLRDFFFKWNIDEYFQDAAKGTIFKANFLLTAECKLNVPPIVLNICSASPEHVIRLSQSMPEHGRSFLAPYPYT